MANNPMFGAPATQTPPAGVSFQSDPSMRSQFKGFMSGLTARQMAQPAPMPQMMPALPQQMSTVDIFSPVPVQSFARGGLANDPYEQEMMERGVSSLGDFGYTPSVDYMSQNMQADNQPSGTTIIGGFLPGGTTKNIPSFTEMFFGGSDRDTVDYTDPTQAPISNLASSDALTEMLQRKRQSQAGFEEARKNRLAQDISGQIQAAIGSKPSYDDVPLLAPDLLSNEALAKDITRRGGTVTVDPVTGKVTGDLDTVYDIDTSFTPYEIDTISARPIPAPTSRPGTLIDYADPTDVPFFAGRPTDIATPTPRPEGLGRPAFGVVGNEDVYGISEFGEFGPSAPASAMESILDRAARKDVGAYEPLDRVTYGFGAGMTPMEQLEARGSREYKPFGEIETKLPTAGGFIQSALNQLARGASPRLLERIKAGGIPQYDNSGQIVGAYMPGAGLFGSTVYFGDEAYRDDAKAREISLRGKSGGDSGENAFLKLLGFKEGGEVQNYAMGGVSGAGMGDSDPYEAEMAATGSSNLGGFDYSNVDDSKQVSQSVMATPMGDETPAAQTMQVARQQDVVPVTQAASQQAVQQPRLSPREVISQRVAAREAEAGPSTFTSLLGDLFDFSTPADSMSDLERAQLGVRERMAARGESYYGQNLSPAVQQELQARGMQPTDYQYMETLSAGRPGGQLVNVPVAAQYERYSPVAAGTQQGVQILQGLGKTFAKR